MPYKVLRTGGSKSFTPHWFDNNNDPLTLPEGTTFSALTTDFNVATAFMLNGKVVVTPVGNVTGNIYVSCVATLPTGQDVYATILVHVTDNTDETTDYGTFSVG
jgi:hypothetical protein